MPTIYGVNPVLEQMLSDPDLIEVVHVPKGPLRGQLGRIARQARELKLKLVYVDRKTLNRMADGGAHQGVVMRTSDYRYTSLKELLAATPKTGGRIVVLDGVQDPHNLGAVVRTVVCAGSAGVVIPERGAAGMTAAAIKASAGAASEARIVKVKNIVRALEQIKEAGLWSVAVEAEAEKRVSEMDRESGYALVFGSEGKGIRRLVRNTCDMSASIPVHGNVDSLNVSVSVGVVLYSLYRSRQ